MQTDTLPLYPTNDGDRHLTVRPNKLQKKMFFFSVKPNKLHRQTSSCLTPLTTATDPLLFERETDTLLLDPTNLRDRHLTVEPSNCEKKTIVVNTTKYTGRHFSVELH